MIDFGIMWYTNAHTNVIRTRLHSVHQTRFSLTVNTHHLNVFDGFRRAQTQTNILLRDRRNAATPQHYAAFCTRTAVWMLCCVFAFGVIFSIWRVNAPESTEFT